MPSGSQKVRTQQYLSAEILQITVDGSAVTTSFAKTGLTRGSHCATIKKGTAGDSNLITIRLNRPCGLAPGVFIQERTLDCVARLEAAPGLQEIQIRTLELDGTTVEDDADLDVLIFKTREIRESDYK